jgi:hypothetical protein
MYKILTSTKNEDKLESALLYDESDYNAYIKDKKYIKQYGFKDILFNEPKSYPVILVTHFAVSFNCEHRVYGEYIYPAQFEL